ncbi:MAG: transketolase [Microthrixaceae bacterium]
MTEIDPLEQRCISVVRGLSMDGPQAANSGHQGTAMALAPLAHVLWTRQMSYDPASPDWPDRDRFVLSAGHASILQYSMLYLTGYPLTMDDLRQFRQWGSATPGHPEAGHTAGVEVTTGPLGQGFGNAVGMALAERNLRARLGSERIDHRTWVVASDGDLMEGISHEAASLAGVQGLGRLTAIYDDNRITIDGATSLAFTDDTASRFRAYGWEVIDAGEPGDDLDAIDAALEASKADEDRPTLVIMRTRVGTPSPTWTDHPKAHGNPFNDETIAETKAAMGLPDEAFFVPDEVVAFYREAADRRAEGHAAWRARLEAADETAQQAFETAWAARPGGDVAAVLPTFGPDDSPATRVASQQAIDALAAITPSLCVGSADLSGNTGTKLAGAEFQSAQSPGGMAVHYGVREHAMAAAEVGMALHGGIWPVGGTFLVFSDYARPSVRLAALARARATFVWSHDSVGVGEDGPTHQPVEQVMALRTIPDLVVFRPADGNETAAAWAVAADLNGPCAMILSRQGTPTLSGTAELAAEGVASGAYVLADPPGATVTLVGTGTEVAVALEAARELAGDGIVARVVSMPSWELFEATPKERRDEVLPKGLPTVSVEAGVTLGWARYAQATVGIDRFGASAPGSVALEQLGITPAAVADAARGLLEGR